MLARAGLIPGPYERVGRLRWWLRRLERRGQALCPGPRSRPLQYIDGRDLAAWLLTAGGTFNTVSRPGHATMGELLETAGFVAGAQAELIWVSPALIAEAGIAPWTELPIWVPPEGEFAGLHDGDVSSAYAARSPLPPGGRNGHRHLVPVARPRATPMRCRPERSVCPPSARPRFWRRSAEG